MRRGIRAPSLAAHDRTDPVDEHLHRDAGQEHAHQAFQDLEPAVAAQAAEESGGRQDGRRAEPRGEQGQEPVGRARGPGA